MQKSGGARSDDSKIRDLAPNEQVDYLAEKVRTQWRFWYRFWRIGLDAPAAITKRQFFQSIINLAYPLNISDVFDEFIRRSGAHMLRFADVAPEEFELIQNWRFRCEKQFNPMKDRNQASATGKS